jgi:uncharacterized phage protein (TIGR02220 family)
VGISGVYGKIFDSMYRGTLYGQWEAIVTFQQLIVLCDADGVVDYTPPAISSITSIPLEIIQKGLEVLSKPDPYSRTPGSEGRRIELIDAHRPWGWVIVNHKKYQSLQDSDTVREQTRERVRKHRELKRSVTDGNGQKRHTDTYTDTDTKGKDTVGQKPDVRQQAKEVLNFLNSKTGRNYEAVPANLELILARLKEGATVDDLRAVVAKKCREWAGDEKMAPYLRPATLFGRTKFAQYKGEIGAPEPQLRVAMP